MKAKIVITPNPAQSLPRPQKEESRKSDRLFIHSFNQQFSPKRPLFPAFPAAPSIPQRRGPLVAWLSKTTSTLEGEDQHSNRGSASVNTRRERGEESSPIGVGWWDDCNVSAKGKWDSYTSSEERSPQPGTPFKESGLLGRT